jgi:hypothetical protein
MNRDQAIDVLIKHSEFFELYTVAKYVPRAAEQVVNEVQAAYKVINPGHVPCPTCNDPSWLLDANRYRIAELNRRENEALKFMTFPKQNPKKK